ncbi:MAG: c-type cytochrome [Desulfoprunum sp.]|nr:c-type cytochrome [Desulfoprunum sp.]
MLNSLHTHMKTILLALTGAAILAACGTPAGNIENGQRWYTMYNCSACHGKNANDGRAMAIRNLNMGFTNFEHILRKPYSPSMPAFSEQKLAKQDAADIYAWLKSLK